MNRPTQLPPYGLCLPCVYRRCRDGDTVEISLPKSERVWAIRLIGVDCPALHEPGGNDAKVFSEDVLSSMDQVSVYIPAPNDVSNLLKNLTFDRVPGYIFPRSDTTLGEMLMNAGHAEKRNYD